MRQERWKWLERLWEAGYFVLVNEDENKEIDNFTVLAMKLMDSAPIYMVGSTAAEALENLCAKLGA